MKPTRCDPDPGLHINMTPMIDVVFLLIIFFLVSSHLAQRESRLPLPLPSAATGVDLAVDERPRLTLNVLADGALLFGGEPVGADELATRLKSARTARGQTVELRIRADKSAPYGAVNPAIAAAAEAGIWHVHFAVTRPQGTPR
jgi:biopolymer transport protein ExbD